MKELRGKHVVFIVENLSVPFDRRVWREAKALKENEARVSVICPKGFNQDKSSFENIDGIDIYRYSLPLTQSSAFGYLGEYLKAFFATLFILLRINSKFKVSAIHVANPLEIFFPLGWLGKILGYKFIFDHHDLSPESFAYKFKSSKNSVVFKIILLLEKLTVRTSSFVFTTNESMKEIVMKRDKLDESKIAIVRNGPDKGFMPVKENYLLKKGRKYLLGYIGVMGTTDGVENIIKAVDYLIKEKNIKDFYVILIGYGDEYDNHLSLISKLGLNDYVEMPGRLPDKEVKEILSTCDICLAPDPENGLNEFHTMNKIMDYMRFGKPIVSFNLKESIYSAGKAALYIKNNDIKQFAEAIITLMNNEELRNKMGEFGKEKVENKLTWEYSKNILLKSYKNIFS